MNYEKIFIFVLISSILSAQIVDEYPFEDVYELCGEESIELNTPEGFDVIFGMNYLLFQKKIH